MDTLMTYPFADRELARRLESAEGRGCAALAQVRAGLQRDCGAAYAEIAGAHVIFDGTASPLTQTFGLGVGVSPGEAELEAMEAFFAERGAATSHEVTPLVDAGVLRLLHARGYEPVEQSTVLYQPLSWPRPAAFGAFDPSAAAPVSIDDLPYAAPSGVMARLVDEDEADLWAEVAFAGWAAESAEAGAVTADLAPVMARCACHHCFIAELDGWPIAAGAVVVLDGVAVLAGASTVPWRRRCGAQTALLGARLEYAARLGCDTAMIVAAPGSASQRNAERRGFRVAYTRTKWRRPPS